MAYINKNEFFYDLPEELIAQTPAINRESSRLMTLSKKSGMITHGVFSDVTEHIMPGDCLVINNTKVIPARLRGQITGTSTGSSEMELLLVSPASKGLWEVMAKPGKKARIGTRIIFGGGTLIGEIIEIKEDGNRLVLFTHGSEYPSFRAAIDELGEMPLPPYIKTKPNDTNRYQTVYAKHEGSVAAPTAGLHFTPELLEALRNKGVRIASITLHVGPGTFRPVKTDDITQHKMHPEFYDIDKSQAEIINSTRRNGGRIIAVGTTSCRTLEACADENGFIKNCSGSTDIFIYPGYDFKAVDGLITNFHLPESTLIMLVSALCGTENTLKAYKEAVSKRYRFFSFGDAMFIY